MEKLANIIRELKAPKNQNNKFGGYKYRSCEDILEAVKPLLNGAILTISDDIVMLGSGDKDGDTRYYIKATATFRDGDFETKTTAYARESLVKKGMDDSQITGAASSYARKYALNGLFCIDDTKDADTMDNRPTQSTPRKQPTTEQQVGDSIPFATPAPQTRDWADAEIFGQMLEFCDTVDAVQDALNQQRNNPNLQTLIPLATAKKHQIEQRAEA